MKANVDLEYIAPFTFDTYALDETAFRYPSSDLADSGDDVVDDSEVSEPRETSAEEAPNDLGYFMNVAGRYRLLTSQDERRLGLGLWRTRQHLLRLLVAARHPTRPGAERRVELGRRPITAASRRRLARAEKLARCVVEGAVAPKAFGASPARLRSLRRKLERSFAELDDMRRELVEHNLRLVVWVAKNFRGRGFDFIDLIQEGSLGLMRAIDRYDPRVGARFSTFATHWIQQGIRRALAEKARTIRIPVNRIPEVRQALVLRAQLSERLGRAAGPDEIAARMGIPKEKVEELLPAIRPIDSIDAPVARSDRSLGDLLEDRTSPTPLDAAIEEETRRAVKAVLGELPDRQRVILSMRHGIGYPRECTLEEIGEALGLSRERIRQVEKTATGAVRDWLQKHRPQLARPV